MNYSHTVVIIASDVTLELSLAFALRADGYRVKTFKTWQAAQDAHTNALCLIVDQDIWAKDETALKGLDASREKIVLLTEHLALAPTSSALVLTKPLTGSDVLNAVGGFRADAASR